MSIVLYFLVVYSLSFAVVYKRPKIFSPFEWLFKKVGLEDALNCMLCMPVYIGAALTTATILFLPKITISPSLYLFGTPENWLYFLGYIFIDMLSASGIIYLIDQIQVYLENNYNSQLTEPQNQVDWRETDKPEILHG